MEHLTADVSAPQEALAPPAPLAPPAGATHPDPDLDRALARAIRRLIVAAEHRAPGES